MLQDIYKTALITTPDKPAVIADGVSLTYSELDALVHKLASYWHSNEIKAGDRIALWLPNCPEAIAAYLACFRLGAITVALDYRYTTEEATYCLEKSGALFLLTDSQKKLTASIEILTRDQIPSLPGFTADIPLLQDRDYLSTIFFTSGTTSRPKGVTHTSRRTCNRIEKFIEEARLDPDSVSLVPITLMKPLAFQLLAMAILQVGGTIKLVRAFTPEAFWNCYLTAPQPTILALTPNLLALALNSRPPSLDTPPALWLVGGDKTPAPLHTLFKTSINGELVELCGMTETGPYAMNPPFGEKRIGSIGVAPIGVALRIVDESENDVPSGEMGELVVRTPDTMVGYWNDTLATYDVLREGWIHTGDFARCDEDGYIWLTGRMRDMIIRDGSNIAPSEIERTALQEIGILAAAAIGIDDPPHGQSVQLFVSAQSAEALANLHARLSRELRPLAIPSRIHKIETLPTTAAGKIDRAALKLLAEANRS